MEKLAIVLALILFIPLLSWAQPASNSAPFELTILDEKQAPLIGATLELFEAAGQTPLQMALSDEKGVALFTLNSTSTYRVKIRYIGYSELLAEISAATSAQKLSFQLQPDSHTLEGITVAGRKALIQRVQGKTIVNVDAAVTNAGTTVLEVLEKSPGVIVDRNGGISLMGKTGVLVLIDDKPTYLGAAELTNLLGGMSSSQVDQIELITNPSAKYDAQGNAGVINIKTKKNKQRGFNGNLSTSYGQGYYPKSNNSLVLNYRDGRFNTYLTYSSNYTKNYTRLYALREYFNQNDQLESRLDQPTLLLHQSFNNTLKTGFDYYLSEKTTLGLGLTGITNRRKGSGNARVAWENPQGRVDSSIVTNSNSSARFQSGGFNVYGKHNFNKKQQLSIDFDWLDYDINNRQLFNNTLLAKDGYNEGARGYLPSLLNITSLKVDYSWQMGDNAKWEAGYKNSHIDTDNTADYEIGNGTVWFQDYGKTNRFLYQESIHALYSTYEQKWNRLSLQMGLRYERTNYDAHQLGNAERPDSAFSRKYAGFFPSGYLSYQLDSSHVLTLTAGRRLDRPEFQRLNPFVNIINKYTHERGNPFFQPQFTWNLELSHQYKDWLSTAISYSFIRNYFSQLFLSDGEDILIYTRGNVGKMYNLGFSIAANFSPYKWWSFNGQVIFNQKEFVGFQGNDYTSSVAQLNFSVNNQFKLGKVYSGEIAGTYTTRSRNDIQEIVYDSGQLSVGIARPVLKKQGTLKLSVRDILHTRIMEGLTDFPDAEEYFFQYWDTRVLNLAFSYRFGKPLKSARRSGGAASDEMERVGN